MWGEYIRGDGVLKDILISHPESQVVTWTAAVLLEISVVQRCQPCRKTSMVCHGCLHMWTCSPPASRNSRTHARTPDRAAMLSGRHTSAASCEMTQPAPTPTAPRMAGTAKQRWLRPGPPHGCIIARAVGCTHSAAAGSKHSTSHVNGSAPCGAPPPWAPQLPASRWQTPPCGHGDGSQPASQPATRPTRHPC
jgi:hypothetical protein